MEIGLRDSLTFCEVAGRHLFLDVARNRYFCLTDEQDEAFRFLRLGQATGRPFPSNWKALADAGIIVAGGTAASLEPDLTVAPVMSSALDAPARAVPWLHMAGMAVRLAAASYLLKRGRLAQCLAGLSRAKRRSRRLVPRGRSEVLAATGALACMRVGITAEDQCLPRSIALAHHLSCRDVECQFVIGVKLGPFAAHSWVQIGSEALNDRPENIRNFSPILVL